MDRDERIGLAIGLTIGVVCVTANCAVLARTWTEFLVGLGAGYAVLLVGSVTGCTLILRDP